MHKPRKAWSKSEISPKRVTGRRLQTENAEIKQLANFTCADCKTVTEELEIDHIVPLSKGGEDVRSNKQPLCYSCHDKKSLADKGQRIRQAFDIEGYPVNC